MIYNSISKLLCYTLQQEELSLRVEALSQTLTLTAAESAPVKLTTCKHSHDFWGP